MTSPPRPSRVAPVRLADLARLAGAVPPERDVAVTGITLSSTTVRPGDLYAALPGTTTHGARFGTAALQSGAAAVLTDPAGAAMLDQVDVPVLVTAEPRRHLGVLAAAVYGDPARQLTVVGVTGTQGKTTTTHLAAAALAAGGRRTGLVGTTGVRIDGEQLPSALTTPEATDLHALFALMRERGVDVCVMEVSSHALVMGRVDGVVFDLAVFTNFGRDHLDFHGDVDSYFAAKADLFTASRTTHGLLNLDDAAVRRLLTEPAVPMGTFSATGGDADWRAVTTRSDRTGSALDVTGPDGLAVSVHTSLPGSFNVANALAALAIAVHSGADIEAAARGVSAVSAVPGRMQTVDRGQDFAVVVDYAHKPDALTAALTALRPVTSGRLIVVLGAGGDRDEGKRPLMGRIAATLADVVVVTDDNPRSEHPAAIRAALLSGARTGTAVVEELADRGEAIARSLTMARSGDTVILAGKGHETGQEVAGEVLPFDDGRVAAQILDDLVHTGQRR